MSEFSRRTMLSGAAAAAAATMWTEPVHAQYVWQKTDWQSGEFDALTRSPRRIKQVMHAFTISDGRVLKDCQEFPQRTPLRGRRRSRPNPDCMRVERAGEHVELQ